MTYLLVALGGAVGAPARYLMDRFVQQRHRSDFPLGTLLINITGCFVLGILAAAAGSGWVWSLAGVGFCGAFTTYSTFGYETVRLIELGRRLAAVANILVSVGLGLGAAALGFALAS
jgi:CrcB protein